MNPAFYTCVTGPDNGYVPDLSHLGSCGFDFVVIHDNHHVERRFPGWRRLNLDDSYPFDPDRNGNKQRYAKTQPWLYLDDYSHSVYLDPKWEITDAFLELCREQVQTDPGWYVPRHPSRSTFQEEIVFPFMNGTLSLEECKYVVEVLQAEDAELEKYFPSLCTWMIRRHDETTRRIGERWFELIQKCYQGHVRDQVVFPFAVADCDGWSHVKHRISIQQLYDCGVTLNYPNQVRTRDLDVQSELPELINFLKGLAGYSTDT